MIKEIVKSSPYIIKKPIKVFHNFIPDYIKYGNKFRNTYNFLEKSQYWTKKEHEEYQIIQFSINYKKSEIYYVTIGGSTKIPLGFYSNKYSNAIENAFMYQQWKRVGHNVNKINRFSNFNREFTC